MKKAVSVIRSAALLLLCLLLSTSARAESSTEVFRTADRVYGFSNGWVKFINDHTFGVVNPKGEVLFGWDYMSGFSAETGLAIVYKGRVGKFHSPEGGVYGLINTKGEEVLPLEYKSIDSCSAKVIRLITMDEEILLYHVETGEFFRPEDPAITYVGSGCQNDRLAAYIGELTESGLPDLNGDGKWGYIDQYGKTVIPFEYEAASNAWVNGLSMVKKDGKYGAVDSNGKIVIPITWDRLSMYKEAIIAQKDDRKYLLDNKGTIRNIINADDEFYDGYGFFCVYNLSEPNSMGIIDATGKEIVAREWGSVARANDHLAVVSRKEGSKSLSGVLDYRKGEFVLPLIFDDIEKKSGNVIRYFNQLGYYGFMDEEFNTIIPPFFTEATSFEDGYAAVKSDDGRPVTDRTGTMVF